MQKVKLLTAVLACSLAVCGAPDQQPLTSVSKPPAPTVQLDKGVFTGVQKGNTQSFMSIPYALPPIGNRRFRLPEPYPVYEGYYSATSFKPSCPQQAMTMPGWLDNELKHALDKVVDSMYDHFTPDSEDCLTINVVKPADATPLSKLPVVVWIFGGGFQVGGTATYGDPSEKMVERSMQLGQPMIYVSMNYRVSALGFLASKEVRAAGVGNLGLQDQRLALKWVQKYVSNFGGDPSKVTIWGQSAGSISVSLHMITNNGNHENLFRGAIMQSGGPIPVAGVENGQVYYDDLVKRVGCQNSRDTLQCLRGIDFRLLQAAIDTSPNFFAFQGLVLAWLPRVDGVFLREPPQHLVLKGEVAKVPFMTGNCDDEGTLFAISSTNLTHNNHMRDYLRQFMLPKASDAQIDLMLRHYPDFAPAGSPFDTGFRNMLGPQFKRMAAIQGDIVFHSPRRFFLKNMADKVKTWSWLSKREKSIPFIGATHATDILNAFGTGELRDYIIRFVNNLDPNGNRGLGIRWPQYDLSKPQSLEFQDSTFFPMVIKPDDHRKDALDFMANISILHPL
ncbi:hypothetical protein EWM64_g2235 [Hericium alpestre]|uniref:Carboxylic ester hydrolase n=1 Tax=Hericium alpestre TaxID=135208 RepID=A0A4Z0A423_9AGAM|nr:hypothetical protein EWM64_g2235 [Hericium alpestre]